MSTACLCVPDYWGECLWHDRCKVWRMQTVKSPLAPAYKQREGFLQGRVYGWNGRMERLADVSGWDRTLRDCADPVRVQTRADASPNIQTKHGRIIRAIIQQSSQSTHCEPVSSVERPEPTLLFSPKLNRLKIVPLSFQGHLLVVNLMS